MPQMSHVLRECAIGMLTAGMSTRAVTREFNIPFSTISHLCRFREFAVHPPGLSTAGHVWFCVGKRFVEVNVVNHNPQVPHGAVSLCYGQA